MPQNCQPESQIAVRSLGLRLPPDYQIAKHRHGWPQLVFATEGVMTVETGDGNWVVPAQRAVWVPAEFEHAVRMTGVVALRTIYVRPDLARELPAVCSVVHVSALLRELISEIVRRGMLHIGIAEQEHLVLVLLDQIAHTREVPLQLKLPCDERARRVAELVRADLAQVAPLRELARGSGASVRTLERLFRKETGLTFGRWSQRVRALYALERLAAGDSVTAVGLAVGYDSTSAFITMFRRVLGTTPGRYFEKDDGARTRWPSA